MLASSSSPRYADGVAATEVSGAVSSAAVAAALPASGSLSTNAVTRNFSDLHAPTWFALLSANIGARTFLFHPIQLAISRKRVTRESTPPTVIGLVKASYRGGRTSAYGATCTKGQYDFGKGGVRGCYRGVGAALLCNLLGETSYLFTLEAVKEYVEAASPKRAENVFAASSYSAAVGAMCGDLVALLLVSPLVIVCNRQMTAGYSMASTNSYTNVPQTFRTVWGLYQKKEVAAGRVWPGERVRCGLSGVYQGLSAGLLRIPSSGCWWGLYTKSKEALYVVAAPKLAVWEQEYRDAAAAASDTKSVPLWRQNWLLSPTDNPLLNAVASIIASVCTTLLFNPIAVIQTRQQALPPGLWEEQTMVAAGGGGAASSLSPTVRKQTWKSSLPFRRVYRVANDLARKEGVRGFFKGSLANMSVAVLDGIFFTLLFEFTKLGSDMQFLEKLHTD
ncbi:Mitochondrial carrier protein / MCP14 [Leishmania donovani]|uniref:Mitochondrial carrier family protein n=1 Tax=Leishmania donovani TaxID=5661 RepID=A0A504Y2W8_LEIDO|nr:Mitochondrial carrier family protein [Leishmania donovani]CAJ1988045.1 Mitochondrial carrier protein / MCP14 [Leishmania donovani]VDZ43932.1 Mitochondrial_carrier_protein_putative/Pfam:PF00153 [Leishmania donovani]